MVDALEVDVRLLGILNLNFCHVAVCNARKDWRSDLGHRSESESVELRSTSTNPGTYCATAGSPKFYSTAKRIRQNMSKHGRATWSAQV